MLINSFFTIIELINNYLYEKKTLLLLLLFFTAFSSCEEDLINSSILEKEDTSINAKTNSSELIKFEKVESDLKSYKSFKLAKKSSNTNVLYRKIVNTENNTVTYTLPLAIYTPETPYYLIQQIIKKEDDLKIQYLKIIPNSKPENPNIDVLRTLTGSLELLDENMEFVSSTNYKNGKAVKRDSSIQSKTGETCYIFSDTVEVKCTNGGNHGVGQSCSAGYTNDAYYITTFYTMCYGGGDWFSQGGGYNSGDVGGGYVFDYQLNALLTNPTFKYADYITDPSHSLLLQAIRQWIPNNVIDLNGDLSALNDRVEIFPNNEQMFYDLETYNQNTNTPSNPTGPINPNMEVTDYSVRVYEMFKFLLSYPTLENGLAARYSVAYLDKNRLISWEDFFMTFKGIGKIMINNPYVGKEEILNWLEWYDDYKSARPSVRDYFNQNPQDLPILFALGTDFFNKYPNISWEDLKYLLHNKTSYESSLGDIDNNTIGGYDNTFYPDFDFQTHGWPNVSPIISKNDFIGWSYPGINRNCMDYAKAQIAIKGYAISNYYDSGQTFQIYTSNNGVNSTELSKGVSYLKYALTNNIPVIVGVDFESGSPNPGTDNTTDHFVVIVGMGSDSKGMYLIFYDNAVSDPNEGANANNKLYYNSTTKKFQGRSQSTYGVDKIYTITMIRKSKKK